MTSQVEDTLGTHRLLAFLSQLFGGLALLLAAIGLYGLLNSMVARRTREVGVRLALGASRGRVGRLVVRDGAAVTVLGLAVGVLGAIGAARFARGQLYGVAPEEPWVLATAAGVLLFAGAVAACLPALRAMRVDPIVLLRCD